MVMRKPTLVHLSLLTLLSLGAGCKEELKQFSYGKPQSSELRPEVIEDNIVASTSQAVSNAVMADFERYFL